MGHYTPRGNLIADYATCSDVVEEFLDWEALHPGESSFSYVAPYPQAPLVNEIMITPPDLSQASEWLEIHNPTDQWVTITGYKISNGISWSNDFWRFPPSSFLGPYEHLMVAHNGANFRTLYGFRPDYEVSGGTGARELFPSGAYSLHDNNDCSALINTSNIPPTTNTAICDAISWGECYTAGFTLPPSGVGQTYGRDANSTDTGYSTDWTVYGGAAAPTPGVATSPAFFTPEIFVHADPSWVPMIVSPGGGSIGFRVEAGNEFATVQIVDFWTNLVLPNGTVNPPLIVRLNKTLPAHDSLLVAIVQSISGSSPAGFYRYNVYVGDYPNVITDYAYFYFEKLAPSSPGPVVWLPPEVDWPGESDPLVSSNIALPDKQSLQAFPNPFNAGTVLQASLPYAGDVMLEAFDVTGRSVFSSYWESLPAGHHEIEFDGGSLTSGLYLFKLRTKAGESTATAILLK
jgi:hypothetical protein